jgi:hypothetical protein
LRVRFKRRLARPIVPWLTGAGRAACQRAVGGVSDSHTNISYGQIVRLYLVPQLGARQLAHLRPEHVQALLNGLLDHGGSNAGDLRPGSSDTCVPCSNRRWIWLFNGGT